MLWIQADTRSCDVGRLLDQAPEHRRSASRPDAVVDAVVEALDPAPDFLVVVNLVFDFASFSLCGPELEEVIFCEHVSAFLSPFPAGFPARTVHETQTAQLAELLRELRDFR
jgi:hypothetical protein